MMDVVVTTGLVYWSYKSCKAPVRSSPPTNQPPVFLQAGCPSCRPTNSVKALKGKYHIPWTCLLTPSSPGGLPTLSLTTNSCFGVHWGRVAMPLVSPLMPVPLFSLVYQKFSTEFHKMQWKVALRPWKKQLDFG